MTIKNNTLWVSPRHWQDAKKALQSKAPLVCFDCETSGLSDKKDQIIELAAIKYNVNDDFSLTEIDCFHEYFNPQLSLSPKIVELTGITDEQLHDKPTIDAFADALYEFFDSCVVAGHNVSFDLRFLKAVFARYDVEYNPLAIIDSLTLAKCLLTKEDVENYKLSTLGSYFGIDFTAHSAIEDIKATAKLLQIFFAELSENENVNIEPSCLIARPRIESIQFWQGYKGFSRIYVNTEAGTVYYDIRTAHWGGKDVDVTDIDMIWLEEEAFRLTNSKSEEEFKKFKATISVA